MDDTQTIREDLKEIKSDIKLISNELRNIAILDAAQNASLEAHMQRTTLNEKRIEKLEDYKWLVTLLTASMTVIGAFLFLIIKGS